jgi:hypothetical protein
MKSKRLIELIFIALFALGVSAALWVHQSFDVWLSQLIQASGRKLLDAPITMQNLRWLATEQRLSFASAQWFDTEAAQEPWLLLPETHWQFAATSWQGAVFHSEGLSLEGAVIRVRQEGLTTNINRLIKQLESVVVQAEKTRKGEESLLFLLDSCVLTRVHVEFQTVKHGVLRWSIAEIKLIAPSDNKAMAFDRLLQHLTHSLLNEIKQQTTEHLITLSEQTAPTSPNPPLPLNANQ